MSSERMLSKLSVRRKCQQTSSARDMEKVDSASGNSATMGATDGNSTKSDLDMPQSEALEAALGQLGHFGLYQRYVLFMLCIPNLFAAMYSLNYVFVADQVPFRCVVPECEGFSPVFFNKTVEALLPSSQCERYAPLSGNGTCRREDFHPTKTVLCDEFVYENMETTYAEFGLACAEWRRTLIGTVRNTALPLALLLTGYVSDWFGRRTAFCIFSACAGVLGIVKALSINYSMYVAFEFFEAALGYGFNSAAYVMMVELAHSSHRAAFACATGVGYGIGGMLLSLLAWRLRRWRRLLVALHAPALLLPLYYILLHESPRWLVAVHRPHEAATAIRTAAKWNKKTLDENVMKVLEKDEQEEKKTEPGKNPWLELIQSRVLMIRMAVCSWCWIASAFVYYGLTINSVSLAGDKYVNFALNMAMEIVASLLLMMALQRFGRRVSIFTAFLVCGVACVIPYFISHSGTGVALYFVGKLAITFAFNCLYVFTAELFPTRTRTSALSTCSLIGRIGSILAPQTPLLSLSVQASLYGVCALLAAVVVLLVPETRRVCLPQGTEDAEGMRKTSPISLPPPEPRPPIRRVLSADN